MAMKHVHFDLYCLKCVHLNVPETEDPCNECLTNPVNEDSHKPVNFIEGRKKKGKK